MNNWVVFVISSSSRIEGMLAWVNCGSTISSVSVIIIIISGVVVATDTRHCQSGVDCGWWRRATLYIR